MSFHRNSSTDNAGSLAPEEHKMCAACGESYVWQSTKKDYCFACSVHVACSCADETASEQMGANETDASRPVTSEPTE